MSADWIGWLPPKNTCLRNILPCFATQNWSKNSSASWHPQNHIGSIRPWHRVTTVVHLSDWREVCHTTALWHRWKLLAKQTGNYMELLKNRLNNQCWNTVNILSKSTKLFIETDLFTLSQVIRCRFPHVSTVALKKSRLCRQLHNLAFDLHSVTRVPQQFMTFWLWPFVHLCK